MKQILLALALLLAMLSTAHAQDDLLNELTQGDKPPKVVGTFHGYYLVNLPTNETLGKGDLAFVIQHRFGDGAGDEGYISSLYGLDFVRDYRIGFDYGISDNWHVGFARSKVAARWDVSTRIRLLNQRTGGTPVSLTLHANVASATIPNTRDIAGNEIFPTTEARLSYLGQLVIAKAFGPRFSAELVPMVLYRGYVTQERDENFIPAIGVGGKWQALKFLALTLDGVLNLSDFRLQQQVNSGPFTDNYYHPIAFGTELTAGGHVFQLYISNNEANLANEYLVNSIRSWTRGQWRMGFNIVRAFPIGKPRRGPRAEAAPEPVQAEPPE